MNTLTLTSGIERRSDAFMVVLAAVAAVVMLASAIRTIRTSLATTTATETTLQWSSDTASWKGGW